MIVIVDEMKVQEDLVFDKTGNHLLGFVDLGKVNNEIEVLEGKLRNDTQDSCEEAIATHMLTVMVRGLFIKMEFPYANFPSKGHIYFQILYMHTCILFLHCRSYRTYALFDYVGSCETLRSDEPEGTYTSLCIHAGFNQYTKYR